MLADADTGRPPPRGRTAVRRVGWSHAHSGWNPDRVGLLGPGAGFGTRDRLFNSLDVERNDSDPLLVALDFSADAALPEPPFPSPRMILPAPPRPQSSLVDSMRTYPSFHDFQQKYLLELPGDEPLSARTGRGGMQRPSEIESSQTAATSVRGDSAEQRDPAARNRADSGSLALTGYQGALGMYLHNQPAESPLPASPAPAKRGPPDVAPRPPEQSQASVATPPVAATRPPPARSARRAAGRVRPDLNVLFEATEATSRSPSAL